MIPTSSRKRSPLTTLPTRVRPRRTPRSGGRRRRPFGLPALLAAAALAAAPLGGALHGLPAEGGLAGERADVAGAPVPVAEPQTAGCTPTGTALQFDGGYKVGMCYVTPDGTVGQAKAGVWASGQSGLLWFFDRGNAEVLVKVLDGCKINQHRWAFVAPVTTLEFNLEVTAPDGKKWTHTNEQGATASTRSDTRAFRCGDESASGAGAGAAAPGEVVPRPVSVADAVAWPPSLAGTAPAAGPSLAEPQTAGCAPTGAALEFDGGYKVSMCYVTPDGTVGQAKSGIWASSQSGLLWFFDRGNAEVLVKVLDGCSNNGFRWVFVAPVTTLEFNLVVTGPHGRKWTHGNRQGETASTKSDVTAFLCTVDAAGLDFSLDAENASPSGMTYARGFFFVLDNWRDKVFVYDGAGKRVASRDFALDAENGSATGIVYAGGFFYVVDRDAHRVYAYDGVGRRAASRDFGLGPRAGGAQGGIVYGGGGFWVAGSSIVYAYDSAGVRVRSRDFRTASGVRGMVYVSGFLHVVTVPWNSASDSRVFVYDGTGTYVDSRSFSLDGFNRSPGGIAYADGFFYVVDASRDAVFAYTEPES